MGQIQHARKSKAITEGNSTDTGIDQNIDFELYDDVATLPISIEETSK